MADDTGMGPEQLDDNADVSVGIGGTWDGQGAHVTQATVHVSVPGSAPGSDPASYTIGDGGDAAPPAEHSGVPAWGHDPVMDGIHAQTDPQLQFDPRHALDPHLPPSMHLGVDAATDVDAGSYAEQPWGDASDDSADAHDAAGDGVAWAAAEDG